MSRIIIFLNFPAFIRHFSAFSTISYDFLQLFGDSQPLATAFGDVSAITEVSYNGGDCLRRSPLAAV